MNLAYGLNVWETALSLKEFQKFEHLMAFPMVFILMSGLWPCDAQLTAIWLFGLEQKHFDHKTHLNSSLCSNHLLVLDKLFNECTLVQAMKAAER